METFGIQNQMYSDERVETRCEMIKLGNKNSDEAGLFIWGVERTLTWTRGTARGNRNTECFKGG